MKYYSLFLFLSLIASLTGDTGIVQKTEDKNFLVTLNGNTFKADGVMIFNFLKEMQRYKVPIYYSYSSVSPSISHPYRDLDTVATSKVNIFDNPKNFFKSNNLMKHNFTSLISDLVYRKNLCIISVKLDDYNVHYTVSGDKNNTCSVALHMYLWNVRVRITGNFDPNVVDSNNNPGIGFTLGTLTPDYDISHNYNYLYSTDYTIMKCNSSNSCRKEFSLPQKVKAFDTYYEDLFVALSDGTMSKCSFRSKSCEYFNKAGSSLNTLRRNRDYVYAGTNYGTLWKCKTDKKDSCEDLVVHTSSIYSLEVTKKFIYVGLQNGEIQKCDKNSNHVCKMIHKADGSINGLRIGPDRATIYAFYGKSVLKCMENDKCIIYLNLPQTISTFDVVHDKMYIYMNNNEDNSWFKQYNMIQDISKSKQLKNEAVSIIVNTLKVSQFSELILN